MRPSIMAATWWSHVYLATTSVRAFPPRTFRQSGRSTRKRSASASCPAFPGSHSTARRRSPLDGAANGSRRRRFWGPSSPPTTPGPGVGSRWQPGGPVASPTGPRAAHPEPPLVFLRKSEIRSSRRWAVLGQSETSTKHQRRNDQNGAPVSVSTFSVIPICFGLSECGPTARASDFGFPQ